MSTIVFPKPDVALASLLDGKVTLEHVGNVPLLALRAYADGKQPGKGLDAAFISIKQNGPARSLTEDPGLYRGDIMLIVNCQLLNSTRDGQTANTSRVDKILTQLAPLVHRKVSQGCFFTFDPSQVITPTTPNFTTGYSTTILNVEWHVTDEFLQQD